MFDCLLKQHLIYILCVSGCRPRPVVFRPEPSVTEVSPSSSASSEKTTPAKSTVSMLIIFQNPNWETCVSFICSDLFFTAVAQKQEMGGLETTTQPPATPKPPPIPEWVEKIVQMINVRVFGETALKVHFFVFLGIHLFPLGPLND